MPVSSASSERSVSAMRRVKNCLRATMGDERLSNLSLELLTECFYTAFQNNFNSYKNSASQSIESIAKIIINAICMKETFPETLKE
jgi:hypothetical protein